jgi:drug/metabolite transporter (DMT)-like permease
VLANLALTVMVLCWGAFFPLLERWLEHWDFYSATLARQSAGAAVLFLGVFAVRRRAPLPRPLPWRRALALGFFGVTVGSLMVSIGVMASSGLSSAIISTTNPVSSALTAAVIYRASPAGGVVFGTVLSVAGGLVMVLGDSPGGKADLYGGEILMVTSNVAWTWMSIAAQRWLQGFSQLEITAFTIAAGAFWLLVLLPVAVASGLVAPRFDFGVESLELIAFAGLLPIAFANFCWHYGVSRIGVVVASMYNNLLPVAAIAVTVWLGGRFTGAQALGTVIILAGVLTAQLLALRR